jgi:hypothetical protein
MLLEGASVDPRLATWVSEDSASRKAFGDEFRKA